MRNFRLTIEYDGTNYFGWQRQDGSKRLSTVQGTIEKAVQRVFGHRVPLTASGRTDTGVHALGQVANFRIKTRLAPLQIQKALNTYLPDDILIKEVSEVSLDFHSRYGAKRKWYRYTILTSTLPSVMYRHHVLHYPYPLNLTLIKKAARLLKGKHDFSRISCGRDKNSVREIYKLDIKKDGDFIYIDVVGNGFLYKMVRRIVGYLIDIGRGRLRRKNLSTQTAPACGLTLMKVEY